MKLGGWIGAAAVVLTCWTGDALARVQENLSVLKPGMVILMQGDSITEGGRWPGDDFNHIMGQDYAYMLAGEIGLTYPERNLTFLNRAVSGNTVLDLDKRWQTDTLDLHPDVLSILVGANDSLFHEEDESIDVYEQTYDRLIAEALAQNPDIKIVLGEPFVLPVGHMELNYDLRLATVKQHQAVVYRLAEKYHLPVVPYQKAFDEACRRAPADHWSWDGVHPTYAGHALMEEAWLKTVDQFWPAG